MTSAAKKGVSRDKKKLEDFKWWLWQHWPYVVIVAVSVIALAVILTNLPIGTWEGTYCGDQADCTQVSHWIYNGGPTECPTTSVVSTGSAGILPIGKGGWMPFNTQKQTTLFLKEGTCRITLH